MGQFVTGQEFQDRVKSNGGDTAGCNLRKQVWTETKGINREDLSVDFVISTAAPDRENDTIAVGGWDLASYLKNPVVLWAHDHGSPPVAQAQSVTIADGVLRSNARFTPREMYPFGHMVFQMYAERFLRATSVGFMPKTWRHRDAADDYGIDFLTQELLEFSCVPVPANPEALALARSKGIDLAPLREWVEKSLDLLSDQSAPDKAPWVPRKTLERLRKDVIEIVDRPVTHHLSATEKLELARRNLERIKAQEAVIELSDDDGYDDRSQDTTGIDARLTEAGKALEATAVALLETLVERDTARERQVADIATALAGVAKAMPETHATLTAEVGAGHKRLAERIGQETERLQDVQRAGLDRVSDMMRAVASDVAGLKQSIDLAVDRRMLDFELALDTKVRAALASATGEIRTEVMQAGIDQTERVGAEAKRQLEVWLDRFKDYYAARTSDLETTVVKHSDRIDTLFRDQRPLLLSIASKIDLALGRDVSADAMAAVGTKLDAFGEALRELVDAFGAAIDDADAGDGDPAAGKQIVLDDSKAAPGDDNPPCDVELDASPEQIKNAIRSAVGAGFSKPVQDAVNHIRGRLD